MGRLDLDAIASDLRARGLEVTIDPGAHTRGSSLLSPEVVVVHDDIIGGCPWPMPGVIRSGVQQPTQYVPGPLYNIWVACDGRVVLNASGVANNAGAGSAFGYVGNSRTVGICRSHHPDVAPATREVNETTAVVAAVVCLHIDRSPERVVGHKEWTTRKADPWNLEMEAFRGSVAGQLDPVDWDAIAEFLQEDDMIIRLKGNPAVLLAGPVAKLVSGPLVDAYRKAGVKVVDLPDSAAARAEYKNLRRQATPWWKRLAA